MAPSEVPSLAQVHAEFEQEWHRQLRVYGPFGDTLRMVKAMAKNIYIQGRIDGMAYAVDQQIDAMVNFKEGK